MSTFLLLTITGLGLGAMYFLVASGLSLIYGLMGVLNFAHGVFLTVTAYALWFTESKLGGVPVVPRFLIAAVVGLVVAVVFAALTELVLIRPLYGRHIEQVLVTVGLALSVTALVTAIWGSDARVVTAPAWVGETTSIFGAHIPNDRWLEIATAVIVLFALEAFLRRTRYGLIVRAGVENRAMVTALGIDVRKSFTLVFMIGGLAAGIAAVLYTLYSTTIDPQQGTSLVIFAFIVVVIGGLGSIRGTLWAAVIVGLVQQYANYYASSGLGDLSVVLLLGIVLILRPGGLFAELRVKRVAVPVAIVVILALVPKFAIDIPYVFGGGLNTPGTLQLLALCLLFGGLALSYDLLFGFTGLLSFGHALYFAVGVYVAAIAMTRWHWSFWEAILFTALVGFLVAVVLGAVSLRVSGIAFAMVTLAFAQAGSILVLKNPYRWTGGEEGFGTDYHQLPSWAVGIFNTKYLYWLALGYAAAVFAIVRWAVNSSPGHVWQAIRENELRVQVLGLKPYTYKLMSFVLASMLATAGGIIYLLLLGGANTQVTTASFTLTLLLMVVLGGTGSRWGAMIGGILYTYADHRLGDLSSSHAVSTLPSVLRTPLQQPLFILGVLFILVVFFVPGGLTRIGEVGVRLDRILRKPAVQEETT